MFCAIDIIMHNVFNSSCENKINLIISYKHNFSYMLDIQSFLRRTTVQLLARWLNITPFILQEVFPCVNYHIEEKNIYSVVSNEGKRRVTFQNEWNKGNVHKDLKLVAKWGQKNAKFKKQTLVVYSLNLLYGFNRIHALISRFLMMTGHYKLGVQGITICI